MGVKKVNNLIFFHNFIKRVASKLYGINAPIIIFVFVLYCILMSLKIKIMLIKMINLMIIENNEIEG